MKTVYLAAALVLAGSAAHAGSSIAFDVDGHKIRITAPTDCQSLSCLQISGLSDLNLDGTKSGKLDDDGAAAAAKAAPNAPVANTAATPAALPAPAAQAGASQPQSPPAAPVAAPVTTAAAPAAPAPAPVQATSTTPAGTVGTASPAPVAAPVTPPPPVAAATQAPDLNSPVGLWATEDNKGNVRIEQCGLNLCGYAEKSGEKILINMKPKDNKWVGRIHDPEGGGNYDSTIALKGTSTLKVQGCAFGGLFCGGQTWKRVG